MLAESLALSAVLFTIGVIGFLVRRNAIIMFMCVELMLNAVNLTFVAFAKALNDAAGQVLVFFTLVVAAAVTDADLRRVADLVYPVFTATEATERASRVTDLLASVGVRPALRADGGAIQPAWLIADSRDALLAGAATALHAQLVDHTPDRLGTCSGHRCADVYIDASPAGDRRFCSVTCQTRTRVAAFRGRKATAR